MSWRYAVAAILLGPCAAAALRDALAGSRRCSGRCGACCWLLASRRLVAAGRFVARDEPLRGELPTTLREEASLVLRHVLRQGFPGKAWSLFKAHHPWTDLISLSLRRSVMLRTLLFADELFGALLLSMLLAAWRHQESTDSPGAAAGAVAVGLAAAFAASALVEAPLCCSPEAHRSRRLEAAGAVLGFALGLALLLALLAAGCGFGWSLGALAAILDILLLRPLRWSLGLALIVTRLQQRRPGLLEDVASREFGPLLDEAAGDGILEADGAEAASAQASKLRSAAANAPPVSVVAATESDLQLLSALETLPPPNLLPDEEEAADEMQEAPALPFHFAEPPAVARLWGPQLGKVARTSLMW